MTNPTKRKATITLQTIRAECEELETRVRELTAEINDLRARAADFLKAHDTQPPATKKASRARKQG
jgi:hypothetical protein